MKVCSRGWIGFINHIIQMKMGYGGYEFTFTPPQENDVLKQAQVYDLYIKNGTVTRNEVREDTGRDPIEYPEMDEPGVFSPQNGFMPITGGIISNGAGIGGSKLGPVGSGVPDAPPQPKALPQGANSEDGNEPPNTPKPPSGKKPKAKPGSQDEGDAGKAARCRLHKEHASECSACLKADLNRMFKGAGLNKVAANLKRIKIDPAFSSPEIVKARSDMHSLMLRVFRAQREKASEIAGKLLLKVRKAEDDVDDWTNQIYEAISGQFDEVQKDAVLHLTAAALSGADKGIADLGITDDDLIASVNEGARDWADSRAAEMVGMRLTDSGELVPNPNAKWVIGDETRKQIRQIVSDAFDDESKMADIQESIKGAGAFSDYRAEMVARSEISNAQTSANYDVWQQSGVVQELTWEMSEQHTEPCVCEDNDGVSVPIGTPFPSGDLFPIAHPNCDCSVFASKIAGVAA
jgi:hypothetical protein